MTDDTDAKLQALATAIGHIANGLDVTPERQSPLTPEMRAGRKAREALQQAGFTPPDRKDVIESRDRPL